MTDVWFGRTPDAKRRAMESFRSRADRLVRTAMKRQGIGPKELLTRMGMQATEYRKFRRWFEAPGKLPAERIGALCRVLGDYELLDILEEHAGRVGAYVPTAPEEVKMEDVQAIQKFVKEAGEALKKLGETLGDGLVDDTELEPTLKEVNDVIAECVRLRDLLCERHREWQRRAGLRPNRPAPRGGA